MCGVKNIPANDGVDRNQWSNEGAPVPFQPFKMIDLAWIPFLALVANQSIVTLNDGNITTSFMWIVYESYILFDHVPFLFTDTLYDSPSFNYRRLSVFFFWGLEAVASIVSTMSKVGAPKILLYNVAPHMFFVAANYVRCAATSNAFLGKKKTWWIFLQVIIDTVIHAISLWYHLDYLSIIIEAHGSLFPLLSWLSLVSLMMLVTCRVHKHCMSWDHFFSSLRSFSVRIKTS